MFWGAMSQTPSGASQQFATALGLVTFQMGWLCQPAALHKEHVLQIPTVLRWAYSVHRK